MKETTYTIDGQSIAFPAPYIIKDFYFPEDAQTEEGWNAVQSHVDECSRSAEYFKAENLKPCNCRAARMLRMLQDSRYELYTVPGRSLLLLRPSCSSFSSGNAVRLHTKKGLPVRNREPQMCMKTRPSSRRKFRSPCTPPCTQHMLSAQSCIVGGCEHGLHPSCGR